MTLPDWYTTGAIYSFAALAGPALGVSLMLGVAGGLFQTTTQIRETAITFVPKLVGLAILFTLAGGLMMDVAIDYARHVFVSVPEIIHVGLGR